MSTMPDSIMDDVAPKALAQDDHDWDERADGNRSRGLGEKSAVSVCSKAQLMTELMNKSETYDAFGSAWKLALRMLHSRGGVLVGTYDDIARMLGKVSKDSLRNWVTHLVDQGVIVADQKGWQLTLTLLGVYMKVATAPEMIERTVTLTPPEDAKLTALKQIAQGAAGLGGRIRVTIEGCAFEDANGHK